MFGLVNGWMDGWLHRLVNGWVGGCLVGDWFGKLMNG